MSIISRDNLLLYSYSALFVLVGSGFSNIINRIGQIIIGTNPTDNVYAAFWIGVMMVSLLVLWLAGYNNARSPLRIFAKEIEREEQVQVAEDEIERNNKYKYADTNDSDQFKQYKHPSFVTSTK